MKTIQESAADLLIHLRTLNKDSFLHIEINENTILVYSKAGIYCPAIYDGYKVISRVL
jgi:hypothetical protein